MREREREKHCCRIISREYTGSERGKEGHKHAARAEASGKSEGEGVGSGRGSGSV